MMDVQNGKIVFECETCPEILETTTGYFNAAQDARKEAGWIARPTKTNTWEHYCSKCAGAVIKNASR